MPNLNKKLLPLYLLGMLLHAFSVVLAAQVDLGVAPMASIPYVLYRILPASLGVTQFCVNVCFLLGQWVWLRRGFAPWRWGQLAVSLLLSLLLDALMPVAHWLVALGAGNLLWRCGLLVVSIVLQAAGLSCVLASGWLTLPGDGLSVVWADKVGVEVGRTKVWMDCSCVAVSCAISLLALHGIVGIYWGTLAAALVCGRLVRVFLPRIRQHCAGAKEAD